MLKDVSLHHCSIIKRISKTHTKIKGKRNDEKGGTSTKVHCTDIIICICFVYKYHCVYRTRNAFRVAINSAQIQAHVHRA